MSRSRNNTNTNNDLYTQLYKLGALGDIIAGVILLYHGLYSIYTHAAIHISLILFTIVKIIGKFMQLPYNWDKYEARIKYIIIIIIYILVLLTYCYEYFYQ